jgi:hypothetical protein
MKFTPKTDEEIARENLWPAGEYSFEILEAADKTSKSGNEMIEMKVKVINDDGGFILVNDYLLESIAYKLKHAAEACGLLEQYSTGSLVSHDFIGKTGMLKLKIQKGKPKDDGSGDVYPDRNAIGDYVKPKSGNGSAGHAIAAPAPAAFIDDTVPF